jgi:hypothetical protein
MGRNWGQMLTRESLTMDQVCRNTEEHQLGVFLE